MGDPCVLVDLLAISPSGWKNVDVHWKITDRSLGDRWDHWVRLEHSLSVCWAFIEHSLSIYWEITPLGDHSEIVLDWVKTLRRPWRPWRSLDDHWQINERSARSLDDRWVLFEKLLRDLTIFSSLNDLFMIPHPCVKVVWAANFRLADHQIWISGFEYLVMWRQWFSNVHLLLSGLVLGNTQIEWRAMKWGVPWLSHDFKSSCLNTIRLNKQRDPYIKWQ